MFLSVLMSMLYVSDMHTYLDTHVKSEQGRSLQRFVKLHYAISEPDGSPR